MIISEYERLLQNSVFFCIYIGKIKDLTLALLPGKLSILRTKAATRDH